MLNYIIADMNDFNVAYKMKIKVLRDRGDQEAMDELRRWNRPTKLGADQMSLQWPTVLRLVFADVLLALNTRRAEHDDDNWSALP